MTKTPTSAGGIARAKKLSPERRAEISKMGVERRKLLAKLPNADYKGVLKIGDMEFSCYVLSNGKRVISENDIHSKFGSAGGKIRKLREQQEEKTQAPIPLFLASKAIIPLIPEVFSDRHLEPIHFKNGSREQYGYDAEILPKVCELWLLARDRDLLQAQQLPKAKKAEILVRGLARVGIVALVDEATGYQRDRARDSLAKILEAYVAKELQPYVKTFDAEFYQEMFRLRGLPYPPEENKNPNFRPQYFGILTNNIVYDRLAPGVKEALKKEAKKVEKSHKLFQHLTAAYGRQELIKHLGLCVGLMKISPDWAHFEKLLDSVKPKFGQMPLHLLNDEKEK